MEGYLHLESGEVYKGKWSTKAPSEDVYGELVFFTGMTGYQEVLTDPSYKDQILVFTYPLIGNYGINEEDFESSKPHVAGVIVFEDCQNVSHYKAKYTLKQYLEKWNIPMLSHVDTRAVVKKIREYGTLPASLSNSNQSRGIKLEEDHKVVKVSNQVKEVHGNDGSPHIVLVDYGNKKSILTSLLNRDCKVTVVPYQTSFEDIKLMNPDGILLSNGPGNPKELKSVLPTVKKLIQSYPTLGICLGHQLSALALGADTKKLLFGHRGANHPIKDKNQKRVFMSSQNHSYVVDENSLAGTGLFVRFINLHDQSIEGLSHKEYSLQTVQFHPEAHPGPSEANYIFEEFLATVKQNNGSVIAYA